MAACDTPGYGAHEIRLGLVYPDSGIVAGPLSAARSGFHVRLEQANADGGIHGRELVYTWKDDAGDASQNLEAVRELVGPESVFGLVEATVSASGGADYLQKRGIPVTGIPAEAFWSDPRYRNMFTFAYPFANGPSVTTFGEFAKAQGVTRAAMIQTDVTSASNDLAAKIISSFAAAGIPIAPGPFVFKPMLTDPVDFGRRLATAQVDVVASALGSDDLARLVRGMHQAGAPVKVVLSPNGYDTSLIQRYGGTVAGLTAALNYVPFEIGGPAHQKYLRAMSSFAPELQPPDQELAFITYILTDLFLDGLQRAGDCPTRAEFIDALRASTYDGGGLLPAPVDMTRDFGQVALCYTFMQVNAAGTGYQVVPSEDANPANRNRWCGHRLDQ